ncbi:Pol Polyprotein [Phytophthora megakarya]|uniref:Pol Polyprotein n=1 Tax=Phytophthora megakarya TaxID=4795 RepID=A0A225W9U6_9STRA|nr:Pol Polyprotein [Phytophthora megakarya]
MKVDVKILSKTRAFRLQKVHPLLIHLEQKGFIKGRSLHYQIRFVQDLQDLVPMQNDPGYALFLAFAKAYDRVNWDYLY